MSASGKNDRQPRSEKSLKRTIIHTHDKQSNDLISNSSGPANGLRRSSRYRVPPLDLWRNERLVFKALPSGDVQCIGIDKGTEADNYGLLKILKRTGKKNKISEKEIESEISRKQITQVTGDQLNHSKHKISTKAEVSKNKRAALIDNNEVQSDMPVLTSTFYHSAINPEGHWISSASSGFMAK
ncbi:hypothetical protein TNCT_432041 [Trichonephila clavata]|uniref:Uncharacterized protein n=1 Tax=Trichonephila clavata TaxID=2740835 RepID=A0A8X6M5H0_TRICU|nr:hypothetical protein TNCT_432041 [Trichonephila clavata]